MTAECKQMEATMLSITTIHPSPENRTVKQDTEQFRSLAQSLQESGLIQPIVVRPITVTEGEHDLGGVYEIVAGERRWRAARYIGWTEIPAIIREDLTDESAHALRIIENLQREDVPPLEQAAGVAHLLKQYGDPAEVASRLGVSDAWVRTRANLTNLSSRWIAELRDPETDYTDLAKFVTWQEELAKLPRDAQDHLLTDRDLASAGTLSAFRSELQAATRRLSSTPWWQITRSP